MRVYFINPPAADGVRQVREGRCMQRAGAWTAVWTPISLALCAALIRADGGEVKLSDCIVEEVDFSGLKKRVGLFQPDLAVVNAATPSLVSDLKTVEVIKSIKPDCFTAIIGIHGTALPESCFELAAKLDIVVRGEPEYTLRDVAGAIKEKRSFDKIPGISFRKKETIINNLQRPPIENLDKLPFPAWDLIRRELYIMPFTAERFLLAATARGCPHSCTFCADNSYYGRKLRLRSPGSITDELAFNQRKYGISQFLFWTESFTLNGQFAQAVAEEIIRRGLKIKWVCNSRVDNVNGEMLKSFKRAGCWMIGYGVESGVARVLNSLNKGITLEQTREAVHLAREAGLEVTAHCILGFPGETKEDIRQTIKFVKGLKLDFAQFYCAVPFPGSKLYQSAKEKGWINSSDWTKFEQNFSVLDTPILKAAEVMELRKKAFRQFYLRPQVIWRMIRRIRSRRQFKQIFKMVRDFLTWV